MLAVLVEDASRLGAQRIEHRAGAPGVSRAARRSRRCPRQIHRGGTHARDALAELVDTRQESLALVAAMGASATTSPIAPATPIAGAPRTASVRIASQLLVADAELAADERPRQQPLVDDVHRGSVRRPAHRFHRTHSRS
jgi:hypothetical protein